MNTFVHCEYCIFKLLSAKKTFFIFCIFIARKETLDRACKLGTKLMGPKTPNLDGAYKSGTPIFF